VKKRGGEGPGRKGWMNGSAKNNAHKLAYGDRHVPPQKSKNKKLVPRTIK